VSVPATPAAARPDGRLRPLALALPLLLMAAGALETPSPWSQLWILVPALGAAGYLANLHRWRLGWLAPAAAVGYMLARPEVPSVWGWVLVGAVAAATLFGLARREALPLARGLWSMLPLVGLTLAFPFSSLYEPAVSAAAAGVGRLGEEAFRNYESLGIQGGSLGELAKQVQQASQAMAWVMRHLMPTVLFVWAALLVALATLLARRAARAMGRPLAPGEPFLLFRLPEGAVWLFLLGLGFVALRRPELLPAGVNLTLCVGLGYCLQGMAVIDFAMLARGFPAGMIWILFLFVTFFALPVLVVTSTGLGLADIWFDLRRRAADSGGEERGA
jgi:hypothetical protein